MKKPLGVTYAQINEKVKRGLLTKLQERYKDWIAERAPYPWIDYFREPRHEARSLVKEGKAEVQWVDCYRKGRAIMLTGVHKKWLAREREIGAASAQTFKRLEGLGIYGECAGIDCITLKAKDIERLLDRIRRS